MLTWSFPGTAESAPPTPAASDSSTVSASRTRGSTGWSPRKEKEISSASTSERHGRKKADWEALSSFGVAEPGGAALGGAAGGGAGELAKAGVPPAALWNWELLPRLSSAHLSNSIVTFMLTSCCWRFLSSPFTRRIRSPLRTGLLPGVEFQRAMAPLGTTSSTSSWEPDPPGCGLICMPSRSSGPERWISTVKRSGRMVPAGRQRATTTEGEVTPRNARTSKALFTATTRSPTWSCCRQQAPSARRASLKRASAGETLAISAAGASFAAPPQLRHGGQSSAASPNVRPSRTTVAARHWTSCSLRATATAKHTSSPRRSASWMAPGLFAKTPWPPLLAG
mmetsp:Transcript_31299/g.97380  ORF Transcript_31299/g.97380 Transcript_31299/m.97380 type:complete len:339 (-) Transcript_31299:614-1630(-)